MTRTALVATLMLSACGAPSPAEPPLTIIKEDATDLPLEAGENWLTRFKAGDAMFDQKYRDVDGLGPLYVRNSCAACHQSATRGPGSVEKMAQVESDGSTPVPGEPLLPYGHTVRPYCSAGATQPLSAPAGVKVSKRVGPALFGRGYLEAIDDAEILRVEAAQAASGGEVSGRVNRVTYASEANPLQEFNAHTKGEANLIGRFGLKARIATLDEFAADAFQGDMGITTAMRPTELPNAEGVTDDLHPGVDESVDVVNGLGDYMRLLRIPTRVAADEKGAQLFASVGCAACHVPSLHTRSDYPIAALADIEAPVYSDLLLHDMGEALADGLTDGSATGREWRTAPLMGMRHSRGFLHDGRANDVSEAIAAHQAEGSESNSSAVKFNQLDPADQQGLLSFVESL